MDVQDQKNNHSGQEVHAMAHLCPKCGWPYPNPHPSAKHRRAHRKLCGKIDGYKSVVESDSHLNVSDDEHERSDEDNHTPGLKVLERSLDDGGSNELVGRSDGSKEEVFSDAVAHFPEGIPTPLIEASSLTLSESVGVTEKKMVDDLNGEQAHGDNMREEIVQEACDSTNSLRQKFPVPESASDELLTSSRIKEQSNSSSEQPEAKFVDVPEDSLHKSSGVVASGSVPVLSETSTVSSTEVNVSADSEKMNEHLLADTVKEGDVNANEQTPTIPSLPSKDADVVSTAVLSEGVTSMEEECNDAVSTAHQSEIPDAANIRNFSGEIQKQDENFHEFAVPKEVTGVECPEKLIEGYKDYPLQKLCLSEDLALPETILKKEDSPIPVSEDSSISEMKVQMEVTDVPSSDVCLPKDSSEPDDDHQELKEDVPTTQEVVLLHETVTKSKTNEDNACKSDELEAKEIVQDLSTVDLPVDSSLPVSHETEAAEMTSNAGKNDFCESDEKSYLNKSHVGSTSAPEILTRENDVHVEAVNMLNEVERASDIEKHEIEQASLIETREGCREGNEDLKVTAAESAVLSWEKESAQLNRVSDDHEGVKKDMVSSDDRGQLSSRDAETKPETTIENDVDKGAMRSVDTIPSNQGVIAVENNQSIDPSAATPKIPIKDEDADNFVKPQPVVFAHEASVDSNSQTDSLEGHWGSVSVLSAQSDLPIASESEVLPLANECVSVDARKSVSELEGKDPEKTDDFEAPSFMTLVEHRVGVNRTGASAQDHKKNEEVTSKVNNWGMGKHHSPLKNLLVEATQESKLKSSSQKDCSELVQKDETVPVPTVGTILAADDRKSGGSLKLGVQEWDSPARYPADIKREKRKVKGRTYWVPFICCSSVN